MDIMGKKETKRTINWESEAFFRCGIDLGWESRQIREDGLKGLTLVLPQTSTVEEVDGKAGG